ncbi:hypothetical protein EAS62_28015 [Bradyrhizobium zhanjiangense]|uniref:Uncharacterized protein n=1 Tax=Bradyrhizobium zhanjiangense TaxID=1325107 RepID=A0ABY0DFF5_9BRAD|nr:hypothetical protein EAS62_28015 [Bradyrhizobium zhanjiangense]
MQPREQRERVRNFGKRDRLRRNVENPSRDASPRERDRLAVIDKVMRERPTGFRHRRNLCPHALSRERARPRRGTDPIEIGLQFPPTTPKALDGIGDALALFQLRRLDRIHRDLHAGGRGLDPSLRRVD